MIKINYKDRNYPESLSKLKDKPQNLYLKGNNNLINSVGIAVIGTRNPSEYGKRMCKIFTKELVQYGITIISGMAYGIDAIAHKTCLENGGYTIAVLPNGFNYIYPKENTMLFKNILDLNGLVVSEYEKNEKPESRKFLERNRIVAGLAIGTLVVEAGYRSGTSVTARMTKAQKKPVFCVPSSLDNRHGIMCNTIIQEGAKLVTCVDDIINEYKEINFVKNKELNNIGLVGEEFVDVYNVLTNEPQHIDQIAKNVKCNVKEVNYKLMMLELEGYILKLPGNNFIRK